MGTNQIHNVVDPSSTQDAATKNYVDTQTQRKYIYSTTSSIGSNMTEVTAGDNTDGGGPWVAGSSGSSPFL